MDTITDSGAIESAIRLLSMHNYIVLAPFGSPPAPCGLELDDDLRVLAFKESQVSLSPYQARIVRQLLESGNRWCSRERLNRAVWGVSPMHANALAVHMVYVQHRLRQLTGNARPVLSSRSAGFRLAPELLT